LLTFKTINNPINGGFEIVKKQKTAAGSKLKTIGYKCVSILSKENGLKCSERKNKLN
jgi:hypothetical protein